MKSVLIYATLAGIIGAAASYSIATKLSGGKKQLPKPITQN